MTRRFLIDTDTASDDAVALVLALRHPDVRVEAITVVGGNVPLAQGVQNALYTVELCGAAVPVYAGQAAPLLRPLQSAEHVHGGDGMGDLGLPLHGRSPASGHGVDVMLDLADRYPGELTLVALGPLTNVALALLRDSSFAAKLDSCIIMGGIGYGHGNVTPVAEYNIWVDPEAAKIVFDAGLPLTMVGWDVSRQYAAFHPDESATLRAIGTPLAEFCIDIQRALHLFATETSGLPGFDLPDPIAMAVAIDLAVATETRHLHVAVETASELCRGQTVVDHTGVTGHAPNAHVVLHADRERFLAMLSAAVADAA